MTTSDRSSRGTSPWRALRTDSRMVLLDTLIVVLAMLVSLLLRFDAKVPDEYWRAAPAFCTVAVVVYLSLHGVLGLYGRVWMHAGPGDAWQILVASLSAVFLLISVVLATGPTYMVPLSVPVTGGALALLLLGGLRFSTRLLASRGRARRGAAQLDEVRVVVVGPVAAARAMLAQMQWEPQAGLVPVAVVTDERVAWHRTLCGVPVTGPLDLLTTVARMHGAQQVLLIPGGPDGEAAAVAEAAQRAGLRARVLPTLHETVGDRLRLRDIRDLSVEDLLGRDVVETDDGPLLAVLAGRRVLITGAGGSIGRELALQISRLEPELLLLLDHDETHLHDVLAMLGEAPAVSVLADIRDGVVIDRVFMEHRPDVVFHAAAHKHVPILEDYPSEAVLTNVHGTDVLLRTALMYGTTRFVAISTDKAVAPTSVMGASKRLAEHLVQHRHGPGMRYCAVRFGNVLGSRGSVVPTFVRQVQAGGPVTVTHPDMTRFFMTTHEAVRLVLEAATRCEGGEVFMLDMGSPMKIVDLARRIITLGAQPGDIEVAIEFTGLRPGEKLQEQLHSDGEIVTMTSHPKIMLVRGPRVAPALLLAGVRRLVALAEQHDQQASRRLLFELARMPGELDLEGEVIHLPWQRESAAVTDASAVTG